MMANVDPNIIKNKLQVIVSVIGGRKLNTKEKERDPIITKYACIALTKLSKIEGKLPQ
jgi:hypothetical protein